MYQYRLENVWKHKSTEIQESIITFWISEGILSAQQARQRVNQVFMVALDMEERIIGVNTVYKQHNQQLKNHLYYYRTFISPKGRKSQIVVDMLLAAKDYLEARYLDNKDTEVIGIFLEVENAKLKNRLKQAIWPGSNFIYIGENQRGNHLRVYYFKNAMIA